jgi:hypothetical protein
MCDGNLRELFPCCITCSQAFSAYRLPGSIYQPYNNVFTLLILVNLAVHCSLVSLELEKDFLNRIQSISN